jgi:polar amino acid transport system substrate-binding protein
VAILTELKPALRPPADFELSPFPLSVKSYGVGLRQGESALRKAINEALLDLEKSGEAEKIYNRWFGPGSDTPIPRTFRIGG